MISSSEGGKEIEVVAVNDLVPADNLAYLVKYDSVQGRAKEEVYSKKSSASVAEDDIQWIQAPSAHLGGVTGRPVRRW